jgi:hypothetical protein
LAVPQLWLAKGLFLSRPKERQPHPDGLKGDPNVLSSLLGCPPTSISTFAARTAAAHI